MSVIRLSMGLVEVERVYNEVSQLFGEGTEVVGLVKGVGMLALRGWDRCT